jgi:formylglycine-generating enzyme required for sulfatase activity
MPLRVPEEERSIAGTMETALVEGLQLKYIVFSGERVAQKAHEIFMKESRNVAHKECDETRCMQNIAEAFQAELIATANVTKLAGGYFLAMSIQNIFDNKVEYSKTLTCENCNAFEVVNKLKELSGTFGASQIATSIEPHSETEVPLSHRQKLRSLSKFRDCPTCPEMVVIPTGRFEMGSQKQESGHFDNEEPVHLVSIDQAFAIGKTEITQGQWNEIMGDNPSKFVECGQNCPVEQVSWKDIQIFIHKLNKKTGKIYRLPSEAEWEYACRGGRNDLYCGSNELDEIAWYGYDKSNKTTHIVASKNPNAYGLYDMSGNVSEWVEDIYNTNYAGLPTDGNAWEGDGGMRVHRGGSWSNIPESARSAKRSRAGADIRESDKGFRLVQTLK